MKTMRTRIAPSPTGEDIHIGNLYTALFNFAVAKHHNGQFIVRIEDTDRVRRVEGSEERILQTLKDYSLFYDEGPDIEGKYGPYRQSDRVAIYREKVLELIKQKKAYYCFCTKERLDELRKKQQEKKQTPKYDKHCLTEVSDADERIKKGETHVVRLNVPDDETISFHDLIRGDITFDSNEVDDQVLLKSDGFPTYHLAVVVDDSMMNISHVIRAEDWISSTPKHVLLYHAFGLDLPVFAHVPLLRNPDKSKLSKRKNPVWARWYLDEGYLPEAVLNYLALMGWSHPEEKEYFSLDEFINLFDIKDVKPVGPIFDVVKLTWMNQHYIQNLDIEELKSRLQKFYSGNSSIQKLMDDSEKNNVILELARTRLKTLSEFYPLTKYIFEAPNKEMLNDEHFEVAPKIREVLENIPASNWNKDKIFNAMKEIMSESRSVKMPLFYVLFTGNKRGLPLPEMLEVLGKEETITRLKNL